MKHTVKKTLSLLLAVLTALSLTVTAFAAAITAEQAEEIALRDAGFSRSQVKFSQTTVDYENKAKVYEVEFYAQTNNSNVEYDYEILASSGKILSKEVDAQTTSKPSSGVDIGKAKAKANALSAFGLSAKNVTLVKIQKERDDGTLVYEIEYRKGYSVKYTCEVNAYTGEVSDLETEKITSVSDKIEIFFEAVLAWFKNIFSFGK